MRIPENKSRNILNCLSISGAWVCCIFYALLLYLPDLFTIEAPGIRGFIVSYCFNFCFYLVISYLICFIIKLIADWNKILFGLSHAIIHIVLIIYSSSSIFLFKQFNLRWNTLTFQIISETTIKESYGFFKTYLFSIDLIATIVLVIILLTLEYQLYLYIEAKVRKRGRLFGSYYSIVLVLFAIVFISEFRFFTQNALWNESNADKLIKRTGLWNLYQSAIIYSSSSKDLDVCSDSLNNLNITDTSYLSKNIVLVIGESFIKKHSSLYGYPLKTNPKLEKRDNLFIFNDVISSANATTISFRNFLSLASVDDSLRWCEAPLFPAFIKNSGYNVVFYSNQYVCEGNHNVFDADAGFFNHPKIFKKLFTSRNHKLFAFDMQMIEDFEENRADLEKDSLNFTIFHLEGQHNPAVERYPLEFNYFTPDSIERLDLSYDKRKLIAEYDNAVRYNDYVVDKIISLYENQDAIIIYFADHGEEIYDFRDKAGRSYDFDSGGPLCLKYQVDIPMMIYMSPKYVLSHPDIKNMVEQSIDKPFMTDDLPHLLLELCGIITSWFNPNRSIINQSYISRKRKPCDHYYD